MAVLAPTGIGRMYGPISPPTNPMGRIEAITAKVARIVGLPISSTARIAPSRGFIAGGGEVAVDVLHHHDGIVNEDADGEDQGKEGDPVQGIADQVEDQHRQGKGHRDGDGGHRTGPPPHEEGDQDRYRDGRQEHVEEKLVVLLAGGFAVVAGDRYLDVRGDHLPLQEFHLLQQVFRNPGGIRPLALGNGDGDSRVFPCRITGEPLCRGGRAEAERYILGRLLRAVDNVRHIGEEDRPVVGNRHHQPFRLGGGGEETRRS